ncbi:glycosyltransferase family 9 protein, partial [Streptomyces achromogenes]
MRSLVVRLDSFGDVLLAGPAVRAVAAHSTHVTLPKPSGSRGIGTAPPADGA